MSESESQLALGGGPGGWRLALLEMANWGTFGGGEVHRLQPEGGWTLLVGENGSGKSTAIDALRTLLAPRATLRGSFNDAAGGQGRRDRTLASYIRGQWSAAREEDGTRAQFLRDEDTPTHLLAVFINAATAAELTLAQVLWVGGGGDHTVYAVCPGRKSVVPDLQDLGGGREMKRRLRERGFTPYDSWSGYARDFQQRMGIPGEGAMEVFNQAIGVKEVVSVRQFLRSHLLAPGQAIEAIRERVIPQFASLEECQNSILRDKRRIELLGPVVEARRQESEAAERKAWIDALHELLPNYYGRRHWELLDAHLRDGRIELRELEAKQEVAVAEIGRAEERVTHCQRALDGHGDSARIRDLENDIRAEELRLTAVRQTRRDFDHAVRECGLGPEVVDEAGFLEARKQGERRLAEFRERTVAKTAEMEQAGIDRKEAENRLAETAHQLEELERRRVLIDLDLQTLREWICESAGLAKEELPFAGELIEVKPEKEDWHGAIERLMHGFGVSLLVPARHYRRVAGLINRTRLMDGRRRGLRLMFHRVPESAGELPPPPDDASVAGCLNHRDEHPLSRWVRGEVSRQFPHRCCRDVKELEAERFGLTREGLIRGGTRHVKDDRGAVDDRTRWVLGWSPEKKIRALAEQKERLAGEVAGLRETVDQLRRGLDELRLRILLLEGLGGIGGFAAIDLSGGLRQLDALKREKEELEKRSEDRRRLEAELEEAKLRRDEWREQERALDRTQTLLAARIEKENAAKLRLESELPPNPEMPGDDGIRHLQEIEAGQEISLENIGDVARKASDTLRNRSSQQQRFINEARIRMGAPMKGFLVEFPEDSKDLMADADYAEDFVRIHERVVRDDLPAHEERFRNFLNDNLTQNIASLDAGLAEEVKRHRLRIEQVNRALRDLEYAADSYVEIDVRERGEQAVAVFKRQLRDILGMGMRLEDADARVRLFGEIRELIEALKKPEYAKLVADSRNWLDFGIRERRRSDDAEIDYFDSSQGKSGGQKAKLAFTILAASLCAQYGLAEDRGTVEGFRLVVIDEIFARTDEANSRRALELFRSMGFQLLLAAPWEAKVRIAEPYVDNYHLALNPEHHASTIRRASREAYEEAKES